MTWDFPPQGGRLLDLDLEGDYLAHPLSRQSQLVTSPLCPCLLKDSHSETYLLGPREMMGTLSPMHRRG